MPSPPTARMPDAFLDADAIRAATFIRHIEIHETLGSTNDRAVELARDPDTQLPALVATRHQTAGRGRGKNTWWSAEGSLTFSVLIDPAALGIGTPNWPQLSHVTAVAVCDALSPELNPQSERSLPPAAGNPKSPGLSIKWPNDVLLDGAKICGILIESPPIPTTPRVIIGIGININNSWPDTVPENASISGTSLCHVTGRHHGLGPLVVLVLRALAHRVGQLANNDQQLFDNINRLTLRRAGEEPGGTP